MTGLMMDTAQNRRVLEALAKWQRTRMECPLCAQCVKEIAGLSMFLPPVLVKRSDEDWEHLTSEAIHAFFEVFRKAEEPR